MNAGRERLADDARPFQQDLVGPTAQRQVLQALDQLVVRGAY
ncbi:MAG: hypothetical protein ACHP7A_10395 [Caulobacterales bacterium]